MVWPYASYQGVGLGSGLSVSDSDFFSTFSTVTLSSSFGRSARMKAFSHQKVHYGRP